MINILLTGPVGIGKSTIINSIITRLETWGIQVNGFRTLPHRTNDKIDSYYIEPVNYTVSTPGIVERLIAKEIKDQWVSDVDTFEGYALEILNLCLETREGIIVMDELGFFESEAYIFQEGVIKLLDSDRPVLGVIKPIQIPFLDRIREKKNVTVLNVDASNRNLLPEYILQLMNKEIGLWNLCGQRKI